MKVLINLHTVIYTLRRVVVVFNLSPKVKQKLSNTNVVSLTQEIDVEVELTANHYGRFEMYLCPNNDPSYEATQECFDRYPLFITGTQESRYFIPRETGKKGTFKYRLRLPSFVTCTQCVIQWTYYTGNMWGK